MVRDRMAVVEASPLEMACKSDAGCSSGSETGTFEPYGFPVGQPTDAPEISVGLRLNSRENRRILGM